MKERTNHAFASGEAKNQDSHSKTGLNFCLVKGRPQNMSNAGEITQNGFFGLVKKNKSNDLENCKNASNIFLNGPLKVEKGEKIQISKLLQGQISETIPNMGSKESIGGKVLQ